jgi:hypothetical protein
MRRILPHLDDVGSTAGSVTAWRDLRAAGIVRSASVMVPCPWYRAAVEDWLADPAQDLGVHLTLTAEWQKYRWRPMIGPGGGLTDAEGFFHRRPEMVAANADPHAVEDEMVAQVERALSDGIRPSHLDAHMGTAFLFLPQLLSVAIRYGIPPLLCRDFAPLFRMVRCDGPRPEAVAAAIDAAEARGWPVFDSFLMGFVPDGQPPEPFYTDLIATAPEGLSFYACHANAPCEMAAIAAHHVWPREAEHRLYADPAARRVFGDAALVTFKDITTDTTREDPAPCA